MALYGKPETETSADIIPAYQEIRGELDQKSRRKSRNICYTSL